MTIMRSVVFCFFFFNSWLFMTSKKANIPNMVISDTWLWLWAKKPHLPFVSSNQSEQRQLKGKEEGTNRTFRQWMTPEASTNPNTS